MKIRQDFCERKTQKDGEELPVMCSGCCEIEK